MNPQMQGPQHDKRRYSRVAALGGGAFICEPDQARAMLDDEQEYAVTDVWLSLAEYEALPEFEGF